MYIPGSSQNVKLVKLEKKLYVSTTKKKCDRSTECQSFKLLDFIICFVSIE